MSAAPGWYSDPAGSPSLRWWDGQGWTTHLTSPAPPAAPVLTLTRPGPPFVQPVIHHQYAPTNYRRPPATQGRPWYRRRPVLAAIAGVVGLVVLLLTTGIVTVVHQNDDAQALAGKTTVQTPPTLAGFTRFQTSPSYPLLANVGTSLKITSFSYGVYGTTAGQPRLLFYAGKVTVARPMVRNALNGFESGLLRKLPAGLTFSPVDPGPLGGYMDCLSYTNSQGALIRQCAFQDSSVLGFVAQYGTEASDQNLGLTVRNQVETRL